MNNLGTMHPTHNFISIIFKILLSGFFAFIILTVVGAFYLNKPLHFTALNGITDLIAEPKAFYLHSTEGFGYGVTNNEGYYTLFDYEKGMNIDVLIMGTSNMLAFEVMPLDNTTNVLTSLSNKIIYNIGFDAHFFPTCANNLSSALSKYKPSEYVVIETPKIKFSDNELNQILAHNVPKLHIQKRSGLRLFLRKNPYLKLVWDNIFQIMEKNEHKSDLILTEKNPSLLSNVLKNISATASASGTKLIIAYHPPVSLNHDGTLTINEDLNAIKLFSDLCAQNGIYFLDMSERFLSEYEKNYTVPYGFANSSVAKGHLNKYGHKMFAEEIYKLMQRIEAQS